MPDTTNKPMTEIDAIKGRAMKSSTFGKYFSQSTADFTRLCEMAGDSELLEAVFKNSWALEPTRNGQWVVMTFNGVDAHQILARETGIRQAIRTAMAKEKEKE
jgi:hypothetical protein